MKFALAAAASALALSACTTSMGDISGKVAEYTGLSEADQQCIAASLLDTSAEQKPILQALSDAGMTCVLTLQGDIRAVPADSVDMAAQ